MNLLPTSAIRHFQGRKKKFENIKGLSYFCESTFILKTDVR